LLATTERERALGQQLGDIQGKGLQAAYENAQAQFERDRAAGMTTGQQNLQARLQTQQLGTQTGLQTALANLSSEQQANVQNQAARLQQMGLNQQQALQAALANQQMGYNVGQQNLQAALQTQQLGSSQGLQAALANQQARLDAQKAAEASRQFGVSSGYQGLGQALQSAQTLGQLGTTGQQANLQRLQAQDLTAAQEQQMRQRYLDTRYQDFLRQQQYPMDQLSYYSSILHGIPVTPNTSSTVSQPAPSMVSQLGGLGLGALALSKMA
jgi:CRISPR/Cas system-associated protein endoribonuclease Cas2